MTTLRKLLAVLALSLASCGGGEPSAGSGGATGGPGAVGVGQGGSQDFGLFRQILDDGAIPGPETLDDIGFFAEHKLEYPAPSCGDELCVHGLVGAMGNMINGAECTILQIGMNSPLQIDPEDRPAMHVVLAVDVSGSMIGAPMDYVKSGLAAMVGELREDDTVSLVAYAGAATVVLEAVPATDTETLSSAFAALTARGATNLYEGLYTALQLASAHQSPEQQSRVLFLSDGVATAGLTNRYRLRAMAEAYATDGIAITTIGVGNDFDVELMRSVGEVGSGNFYFVANPQDVVEVFADEVNTFLYPLALDMKIDVTIASSYQLRANYGTKSFRNAEGGGEIRLPALYLAGRTRAQAPIEEGRRGGGGAIIFELIAKPGAGAGNDVGSIDASWTDPLSGLRREQSVAISVPHAPGQAPSTGWFSSNTSEKAFVMLNIFAGFQMATRLAKSNDPRTASATLEALADGVSDWLLSHPDPDIEDDLQYIHKFIANLADVIRVTPEYPTAPPGNPWPAD